MKFADDFIPTTTREWDQVRAALLDEAGWECTYCTAPLRWKGSSIDHQVPRVQGGTNHYVNLVICCRRCNSSKGGRTTLAWSDPEAAGEL